ncbi:uncharacterized protein C18orf63 homolog isoform X3 [Rhinoderma darwinii]|uniref:uncharacterized protein C18orf63 homolog isoform X3 n=1 Tax=Rhinoderma darwinii TaxID=43563 RepID=UPI003F66F889
MNMNVRMEESIFFWDLPDLKKLCAVKLIINAGISHPDIRDKQVKLCRCLLFLYDDIVASPILEEFSQILVIMSISFYKSGKIQSAAEKQEVKVEKPERVTPSMLQICLFYTITVRLAPYWNKVGHFLIQGADFLSKYGKQDAVAISINVLDNQLFFTVQVHTVRLPPCQLCDFDVASECFQSSLTGNSSTIRKKSYSSNWCYVLPSMKMGKIVHFSYDIPPECPFKSYKDFQNYWKALHGYELPHMSEDVIYCSVYFKFIGEKIFTYPFICLRSQPIQFYPWADLTRVLNTFVDDLKSKMPYLCGFPVNMTNTPVYPMKELSRPLPQGSNERLNNLTATIKQVPKYSDQTMYSTGIIQKTISVDQSLQRSEKFEHPPTSLYVKHMTSVTVPLGSQHFNLSNPVCSTKSESVQKYVPFFRGKIGNINKNDNMKITEGNTALVGSNVSDNLNSNLKDIMPSRKLFAQVSDTKRTTTSNVCKAIKMKSNKENTTLLSSQSTLSERQSCISVSVSPGNMSDSNPENAESSHTQVIDSCKLNCTNDIIPWISYVRKENHNVAGSIKTSNKMIAECQGFKDNIQEESLVVPHKKCRTSKTLKNVDVEQNARDNKLFKLNNADLQDWLKQRGISTKTRDKKEQLVAKIMQFIQQS